MPRVLCFGEVLWDLLPHGRYLGGAPLNVAYHLAQLGCNTALASSVGADAAGSAALAAISMRHIDATAIGRHPTFPTGTATVCLDCNGQARFEILQPAAWDEIACAPLLSSPAPAAIVFGTLALRSPGNRAELTCLLDAFPQAWVVCDLNLRPPFDDLGPLTPFLRRAHLLKFNADEARRLSGGAPDETDWRALTAKLAEHHRNAIVCVTLGGDGACLRDGSLWCTVEAPPVAVRDTVGAGDAFTAAIVAGRLRFPSHSWPRVLRAACQLGAFVANHKGAQPAYGDFQPSW
ncbi:MAG: hypothetical protein RL030_2383 [Pseudomonadota bacterium]|jgi:fructokinase